MPDFLSLVNPCQGTASVHDFSTGNTLPLVARPWGVHHWTLQTAQGPWMFHPAHRKLQGVRLTHQPSPWMKDYGSLVVAPFTGAAAETLERQASAWQIAEAVVRPDRVRATFLRYDLILEMAPSERGAVFAFEVPAGESLRVRLGFEGEHDLAWTPGENRISGVSRDHQGGVAGDFGLRFVAEFDRIPEDFVRLADGGYWVFPAGIGRVEMRLAGSFLSHEMATVALERELAGRTLDAVAAEGAAVWNALLGRVTITPEDERQERTFYSCLYRALLFPRLLDEIDETGAVVHYSPYDGGRHAGSLCADNGFWDTFRTVYPLLALVYPDRLTVLLEGWLNACREGGWSPKWASPGFRDCMIGTHFDAVVADAVAKGVTDWNVEEAFSYLWKNATEPSTDGCFGRRGLEDYVRLGYVPADRVSHAVSRTMDFAYNDFCVAQVAEFLGKTREAEALRPRTQAYRNVFDPAVGFMRARLADGRWEEPFREFGWGGAYIEGGPWQHSFNVPHDPAGLAELFGGPAALCRKLDEMLARPPRFEVGTYGFEIHEMTEMALDPFGQYAHSNQPVHNYLFLYALCGEPEKTSHWVRRVAAELYSPDEFPADEDNGEMAAWYIFACLGLYPFCPGRPEYVRFDPVVRAAEIRAPHLPQPLRFSRETGRVSGHPTVTHQELIASGTP